MKRTFEARGWPVRLPALGAAMLVAAVVVVAAAAAGGPVASGLVNPRGITTGPGDRLLVVESGTGVIDELRKGGSQTFATVPGAVDVATNGLGNTYAVIGGPGPDAPPPPPGSNLSRLVRVLPNGDVKLVADIGAYQVTHPDDRRPRPAAESARSRTRTASRCCRAGNVLVADAAANDPAAGRPVHGRITTVAHFTPEFVPWGSFPFGPPIGTMVAEAVPTAVAVGPDGAYYVSELTGFPFAKGAARIWRIEARKVEAVCDPPVAPRGGCEQLRDRVLVGARPHVRPRRDDVPCSSWPRMGSPARAPVLGNEFPPIGALWAVKNGARTLVDGALTAPGGVTVDAKGSIFVTTLTFGSSRRFSAQPERLTLVRAGRPSVGALAREQSAPKATWLERHARLARPLREPADFEQEVAELGEAFRAELLRPGGLDFADRLADHADRGVAAWGEGDAFGAQVVGIWPAFEVAEALELAEQVVEGLFADPQPGGQLGGPRALRSGVLEDVQVGRVEVVEAALVQPLEHVPLHRLPGHAQERADQRRPEGCSARTIS